MTRIQLITIVLLALTILLSFSANPPQGRTGGPGERTCAAIGCHPSFSPIDGHLEIRGLPSTIIPGQPYNLNLDMIVDQGTAIRGGFQMISLSDLEENIGTFSNPGPSTVISQSNSRSYFEHDPARLFEDKDTLSHPVVWALDSNTTAKQAIFYAAANFANGDGGVSGDRIVLLKDTFLVQGNAPLSLDVSLEAVSCVIGSDGSITAIPQGGIPPYQYLWSTGDTTAMINSLLAGLYSIQVIDSHNDTLSTIVTLETDDRTPPIIQCVSDTLVITSCAPFSYPIPTATDECSDVEVFLQDGLGTNRSFPSGSTQEIYIAIDEQGNSATCMITVINNVEITPDVSIMDIPCHDDSVGVVEVIVNGDNPPFMSQSTSSSVDLSALPEGRHGILITDLTGCTDSIEVVILRPTPLALEIVEIKHPINADSGDGAIDINVSGGTPPYSFQWRTEDEDFSTEEDLSLLFPGIYMLDVTDDNGCMINSDTIRIESITFTTDLTVSAAIRVLPNPTADFLSVSVTDIYEAESISIFDWTGRIVRSPFAFSGQVDVRDLSDGKYLVVVTTANGEKGRVQFIKH